MAAAFFLFSWIAVLEIGKQKLLMVKIAAKNGLVAGGVYYVRLLKA